MHKQYLDHFLVEMGDCLLARELKASLKIIAAKIEDDLLVLENGKYRKVLNPITFGFKRDKNGWYLKGEAA
jgi:hypothetical protein